MKKWIILILTFLIVNLALVGLFLNFNFALGQSEVVVSANISSICGNGLNEFDEACDDGANNGNYGYCLADCSGLGLRCGDGIVQSGEGEECDDGNGTSNDGCSNSCQIDEAIEQPGGISVLPPTTVKKETKIIFEGIAYPWAILTLLEDGKVRRIVSLNQESGFKIDISNLTQGVYNFGLKAKDKQGRDSAIFTFAVTVFDQMITRVGDILMPPTIELQETNLLFNQTLSALGSATPQSKVIVFIDDQKVSQEIAKSSGQWFFDYNIVYLTKGVHSIKVIAQTKQGLTSSFSKSLIFYIEEEPLKLICAEADLNNDGKVDIIDFSILLFWWGGSSECADQNQDNIVNLIDFSIMMYYWTG